MKQLPPRPTGEVSIISELSELKQLLNASFAIDGSSRDIPYYQAISIDLERTSIVRYILSSDASADMRGKVAVASLLRLEALPCMSDEDIKKLGKFFADRIAVPGNGISLYFQKCKFTSYDAVIGLINCLPRSDCLIMADTAVNGRIGKWLLYTYAPPVANFTMTSGSDVKFSLHMFQAHEKTNRININENDDGVFAIHVTLGGCFRYDDLGDIKRLATDHRTSDLIIDLERCKDKHCKENCPKTGRGVVMQSLSILTGINEIYWCRLHTQGEVWISLPHDGLFQQIVGFPSTEPPPSRHAYVKKMLGETMMQYHIKDGSNRNY
ncbi:hypothetical protein CERSUDRAFT_118256, partial [Gelatoporia subvermispora B]